MPPERGCVAETSRSTSECRTVWSAPNAPSHAELLRLEIIETLPSGWESRLVKLDKTAAALSPEDLLVVKLRAGVINLITPLRAGRAKDLELCRALIRWQLVTASTLRQRLDQTQLEERGIRSVDERLREISS